MGKIDKYQRGFRKGRRYVDRMLILRQGAEKERKKERKVYMTIWDLDKAQKVCGRYCKCMWVGGNMLNGIKPFYVYSNACVGLRVEKSDEFGIKRNLR